MSRQRKKLCVVAAVLFLALIGAVLYTGSSKGGEKTPGGVFVSL